jgi:DNA-binding winged helix-turn-helix (wHTH) protein
VPPGVRFVFEPFELDPVRHRLTASGEPVAISERQLDVLLLLVVRAGQIVSKDDLLQAGWKDVAVGDNSLEQAISSLRRLLGTHPSGVAYIETIPRRGYRFGAAVTRMAPRESDAGLDALLAPHRAFIEGRAALETLEGDRVARAREVFEGAVRSAPEYAAAHVGLANACVMQFEMTRADPAPDAAALTLAAQHAREACRLDPQSGEAWATLGFVLDRTGDRLDARAAAKRAVTLEPDNWRHHFRLAYVSWGEERLRAAHQTLALLPDFPLAHWLAATVHVARQVLNEAARELAAGLAAEAGQPTGGARFSAVALHWLLGLIHLAQGDDARAREEFERELSFEHAGQLYARECSANTWYAIGALELRQGRSADAGAAFARAIDRVAAHPMARVGLVAAGALNAIAEPGTLEPRNPGTPEPWNLATWHRALSVDAAVCRAAQLAVDGAHTDAARILDEALAGAPPGNAGWLLPIEPLLHVTAHADLWALPLARLRNRAA